MNKCILNIAGRNSRLISLSVALFVCIISFPVNVTAENKNKSFPQPVLRHSDVVFMYAADDDAYKAYNATFVAWGGADTAEQVARHHRLGIRCTGSMWCLTAGAKNVHEDQKLRNACAVDIESKPVLVPWLFDHTHEGTKTYFGCTNHPDFRALCEKRVRAVSYTHLTLPTTPYV